MARISPTLRTLLESGAVVFCSTDAKKIESYKRREPLKWLLRQSDGSTVAVTTTIERMSQRAGAGLSFDARAMKKVARGVTQVHLTAASATAAAVPLTTEQIAYTKKVIATSKSGAVVPKPPTVTVTPLPPKKSAAVPDHMTLFDVRLPLHGAIVLAQASFVRFSLRLSSKDDHTAYEKIRERLISADQTEVPVAHPVFTVHGIKTIIFTRRCGPVQVSPGVFTVELVGYAQKAAPAPKRKTAAAVKASTAKDSAAANKRTATKAAEVVPPTTPLKDATSPRAHVIFLVDRSPSMLYPASLSNSEIPRQFNNSDPQLKAPGVKRYELAQQQINTIAAALAPGYLIDVYDFDGAAKLVQLQQPAKDFKLGEQPTLCNGTAIYHALDKGLTVALGYVQTGASVLLYMLTDGDNNGPVVDLSSKVKQLLATDKATIAAIGPKSALGFLAPMGVPDGCILDWQGSGDALKAATVKAEQGAKAFTKAVKAKKSSSLKTFFVDVVATALTVAALKKELRDITPSLLRRKLAKYEICKPFVVDALKKDYVPGAAYYQLVKKEELKAGRRIIIQPRDEDCFYAGPKARQLLGLPSDGDVTIEPKNLGDFVIYVQSAAENRKLLPGTLFLYDLSHVDGATSPTWSK